ncbi:MAG TPA: excalibur calcium-binding domain-containing protein, partial [Actinoplanes sp.]
LTLGFSGPADAAARTYGDCTSLRRAYANGVAQSWSTALRPSPWWIRIRLPVISAALYTANRRLDRDRDGIACEIAR